MESDGNQIIALRREKAARYREEGADPFANDFKPDATTAKIRDLYGEKDAEALAEVETEYALAGRILALRSFGNMAFLDLADRTGKLQIVASKKVLGPEAHKDVVKKWDIGDIVGVVGTPTRTKTGELSIMAKSAHFLTKSFRPLPEKWHGLTDMDTRYRQRYVDLIVNPEVKDVFLTRSKVVAAIRRYFVGHDYTEVETPMMHPLAGGATAKPFETYHNALDMPLFLRVAPELYLKRLLVGGLERVFEINRNFRNEGISIQHNPEFTMLEFYQAYAVHTDLMDLTEELMRELVREVHGDDLTLPYAQETIDFSKPFPRLTMEEAVLAANDDLSEGDTRNRDKLAAICKRIGQEVKADWGWGKLLTVVFEETVEKSLRQPTFVHGFPVEVSPLARRNDKDPEIADRWEFFIVGREHANAFSELNDPDDQRERFEAQMKAKAGGDEEAQPFDADYIRALEYGMPPAAGCGIGIDRVVMLLTNQPSIRDVILFPHLRPESGRGE